MLNKVYEELEKELKKVSRFCDSESNVNKSAVQTSALNFDNDLISLLSNNELLKTSFFKEINGVLIFDKVSFSWLITNNEFLPDSFTAFKNKIGLIDENNSFISQKNDVLLSFPYKDCVLEFDSTKEDDNRDEIFLNEVLSKSEIDYLLSKKMFSDSIKFDGKDFKTLTYDNDNLVIKGNNLIGLHSLKPKFTGKIKLMYWDILYNTESDKVPYNDSFKHSSYLTMMKNRFSIAWDLLTDDGLIFIQCSDIEMAYLKVLCDEIFKRENYVNTITVKTKLAGVSGSSEGKSLIDATEFILVFAKDKTRISLNPANSGTPLLDVINNYKAEEKSWKYITVLVDKGEKVFIKKDESNNYTYYGYKNTKTLSIKQYAKLHNISEDEVYLTKYNDIFRTTNAQSSVRQTVEDETGNLEYDFVGLEYVPIKGKNAGKKIEILYRGSSRAMVTFLGDMIILDQNEQPLYKDRISTIWTDIDYNNLKKEGGVELPFGKKPEKLVSRIIELATDEGDYVLDAYFGTGTTGAVALKMNRKFIGLEQLDSHYQKAINRLKNVVNGDSTGVSREYEWNGGGSFIYTKLLTRNQEIIDIIPSLNADQTDCLFKKLYADPYCLNHKVKNDAIERLSTDNDFYRLGLDDKKKVLISMLDKNLLYVNYDEREDESLNISSDDIEFSSSFYGE